MKFGRLRLEAQGWCRTGAIWLAVFGCSLTARPAAAEDASVDAEQALQVLSDNRWFDEDGGGYAPPRIRSVRDSEIRENGWTTQKSEWRWSDLWDWFPDWNLRGLGLSSDWFSTMVLLLLGLVLVATIALLITYSMRHYLPGRAVKRKKVQSVDIDSARLVDLPFEVQRPTGDPLAEAERLMRAGQFDAAIIYFYGYLLLALDQARLIYLQQGKTNRMYLTELAERDSLHAIVREAVVAFESSFFGKHPLSQQAFTRLWQRLDDFHTHLHAAEPSAPDLPDLEPATP